MRHNYYTDEGCYFLDEDFLFNVKCKVEDLRNQGYKVIEILNFDDCEGWYDCAKGYLESEYSELNKL